MTEPLNAALPGAERLAETPAVLYLPAAENARSPAALQALPGLERAVILRLDAAADFPAALRAALDEAGENGTLLILGAAEQAASIRAQFRPLWRKWLRRRKIKAREAIPAPEREARSARAVALLAESAVFQAARTVMIYDHVGGELSLDALPRLPAAAGKRFCYPLCVSKTEMIAMVPGAWKLGAYGIREPVREASEEVPPEALDLVICPGTAFDEKCRRMGMGGGYYDRYLPRCVNARIVMAAFEAQKLPAVPADPWDRPVEMVFTEERVYINPNTITG